MKKESPQSLRTKKLIKETFLKLLEECDFEAIAISDIAAAAGLHRSTVYRYYGSTLSLLGDCIADMFNLTKDRVPSGDDPNFWAVLERNSIWSHRQIKENRELYLLTKRRDNMLPTEPEHVTLLAQLSTNYFDKIVEEYERCQGPLSVEGAYLSRALRSMCFSVTEQWVEGDMRESPEEIAALMTKLVRSLLEAAA